MTGVESTRILRARPLGGVAARVIGSPTAVSAVVALAVAALITAVSGESPSVAATEVIRGALTGNGLRNTLERTVPIAGMAFAFSVPYRAGVVNLGGEGQMILGGLAGTVVGVHLPGPAMVAMIVAIVAGAVVGGLWAMISALAQSRFLLPILLTSLLLNYLARAVTGYLVRHPLADPRALDAATESIPVDRRLPTIPIAGGTTISVVFIIAFVLVVWLYNNHYVGGFESRMAGLNPGLARYSGIGVDRQRGWLMFAAGGVAGAVGSHMILGELFIYLDGDLVGTGFAWTGLMVALLAQRSPWAILAVSFVFAGLQVGGLAMQRNTEISWQLVQVLQATIIIVFVYRFVVAKVTSDEVQSEDEVDTGGSEALTAVDRAEEDR